MRAMLMTFPSEVPLPAVPRVVATSLLVFVLRHRADSQVAVQAEVSGPAAQDAKAIATFLREYADQIDPPGPPLAVAWRRES